jgi:spermidine/putrescine transport system permease protein
MGDLNSTGNRGRRPPSLRWLLAAPALAWYVAFFVVPLAFPVFFSLSRSSEQGGPSVGGFPTLYNYARLGEPAFVDAFARTLRMAALSTIGLLLVGLPLAYFLATRAGRWRFVLLALFIVPYWASFLIRTYSWQILLAKDGPVNRTLQAVGIIDAPLSLLFSPAAIAIGIVYNYLPLMVITLFVAFDRIDRSLVEASKDLGASRVASFRQVTLPLALPGVLAGMILVFVPMTGEYIIPSLLGGGKVVFVGNVIVQQFGGVRDWAFGSALGIALSLQVLALVGIVVLLLRNRLRQAS